MKLIIFCILLLSSQSLLADQKLVLIGGGSRPQAAMERFATWAGGLQSKILVITWATEKPEESFDSIKNELSIFSNQIVHASKPLDVSNKIDFLKQLQNSTGIFFSGGDQNKIMDILTDTEILNALLSKYNNGVVFGGTSAGTAIAPTIMMTGTADMTVIDGSKVETRKGLGLLPDVIVDQHFIYRQRQNRLFGLMLNHNDKIGLGIDEGMAVAITDQNKTEVFGPTQVMKVRAKENRLVLDLYKNGETFSLVQENKALTVKTR